MRVISGSARHLKLKTIEGSDTRPTTDRIKETLFNMLQNDIYNARFLDLFSGSGAIGIEALSRGAKEAVFVENNPAAIKCIRENLSFTKLQEHARVLEATVSTAISRLNTALASFDIVFMDPPYSCGLEKSTLEQLADSCIIHEDTLIIVEASLDTTFEYLESLGYSMIKSKEYKTNKHVFICKQ